MENKRKNVRIHGQLKATYSKSNALLLFGSRIKDISETGLCMQLRQYWAPETTLNVEIRCPDFPAPVKGMARVVWIVSKNDKKFGFEAGLEFTNIPPDDKIKLVNHIRRYGQAAAKDVHWLD